MKTILRNLLLLTLLILISSCSKKENNDVPDFFIQGRAVTVPGNYFYSGRTSYGDGFVRGRTAIELENYSNRRATGTFYLEHIEDGAYYKGNIIAKDFALNPGEIFRYSSDFSFYGHPYDEASITVDIYSESTTNPVSIVSTTLFLY